MSETGKSEIIWRPTPDYVERSRIARFMRSQRIGSLEELQRRSVDDPEWYWDAVVRDVGVRWTRPYTRVLDASRGIQWPRWFPGGLLNFADNCVDKNLDAGRGDKPAIIWEGDDSQGRILSYRELAREVNRLANALKRLGVGEGDRGGVFLPMSPEAALATLAVVRIGATEPDQCPALPVEADRPCLIIYTSGTTGRPKGAVLTHGGFLIKTASDFAYCHDVGEGDRLFWLTDLGWLMGPMLITAALFHGGTAVLFEGVQDYPKPDRPWTIVERHQETVMGLSPTAVRALMPHGAEHVPAHELSSLRILGSAGEPWDPEPYRWLFENVGKARLPIINYTGGTEISGGILGCFPIAPIKPCSFAGIIPGMAAEVFDETGRPVRGQVGELVVTAPWPGMTQGFWKDPARYEETYWSRWKDVWVHGDWALIDDDGFWFLQGRSDDTLKIAGKRLGPAEVESVLVGHPAVAEAGVVGVPHPVKGEAIVCFVVLRSGQSPSDALRAELTERVATQMGKALRPERVLFARDLPKTRSAKIMRRVIRATYLGKEPGDLSSLENPGAVKAIKEAS